MLGFDDARPREADPQHAGRATGIDFVLLVVAADDGPMPQTRESTRARRPARRSQGARWR